MTLFYHLDYPGQPWYLANGFLTDRVYITAHVVTTTSLPPARYMLADADKREILNFEIHNVPAPPGTEVYTISPGWQQAANIQVGDEYPFGTHDFHAVYLLEYYNRTVVGSAAGGDEVTGAAMVGGNTVDHTLPVNYIIAYGDLPLDLNNTNGDGDSDSCPGMAQYSLGKALAALIITDTPLGYRPPRGPAMDFTLSYNSSSSQPASAGFPHFGTHWTFNWFSYVVDDPNNNTSTRVYPRGGGIEQCTGFNSSSQSFAPDPYTQSVLVKTSFGYERRHPDGSKEIYARSDQATSYPHKTYLTKLTDATGNEADNAATISYDQGLTGHLRPKVITDALGKHTTIYYDVDDGTDKIISLDNDFGKTVTFGYTDGRLHTITDPVGIVSEFEYEGDGFIKKLVTPYGLTTFTHGGGFSPFVEAIDPLGGRERVEYRNAAPGISPTDPPDTVPPGFNNAALDVRNSFYWDKKATQMFPPVNGVYDYTKARIQHWLLSVDGSFVSRVPSSEKAPLENRIWYLYPGQSDSSHIGSLDKPSTVARMLNPTTPQISYSQYNNLGNMTKTTDAVDRVTSYVYDANNMDVLEVYQRRNPGGASVDPDGQPADKIATYTYNSFHERLTEIDAAGQATAYTYNSSGQLLTHTNAKGETTTYAYGDGSTVPTGYLASITSPTFNGAAAVTSFLYDFANRVRDVTNEADQSTVTTYYDDLDRKTFVIYPDGTYEEFIYVDLETFALRLEATRTYHRSERFTDRHYNANRQMDSITDELGRTTHYGWCVCGSLTSITDPNSNVTIFNRDLQSRVYQKVFADTSTVNYLYEGQTAANTAGTTSRLKSSTDALNRRTNYCYLNDDNISLVTYTNTSGAPLSPPTPSVGYSYDPNYNRIAMRTDGGSQQTVYGYYTVTGSPSLGAGRLYTIDGPLADDTVSFAYDQLGRVTNQTIEGGADEAVVAFDSLGRVTSTDNDLGHFDREYYGVTPRLQTLTYPNSQTANYKYFGNEAERRLQTLENLDKDTKNLSKFDYTSYSGWAPHVAWSRQLGEVSSERWFEYDDAQQLSSARNASEPNSATQVNGYGYDYAGNRTSDSVFNPQEENNGISHIYTPNNLNQIESYSVEGGMITWEVFLSYDLAGNLIDDGQGKTFEWDAANRLRAINYGSQRSEFTYDGLSRRVKIVEKAGSTVTSTKQFVWVGSNIAQERDASNAIKRSYFAEGEVRGVPGTRDAKSYYYSRDHLGSIREMTNGNGTVEARYDYDPYGQRTKLSGALDVDFGYAGYYHHAPSGLNLTLYRAYDPALGRWLSRDPLPQTELLEGANIYEYVQNNPVTRTDPLGLQAKNPADAAADLWEMLTHKKNDSNNATEIAKAFAECEKIAHSPSRKCKCCVISVLARHRGGGYIELKSGGGRVYDRPCSEVSEEGIYSAEWENHTRYIPW